MSKDKQEAREAEPCNIDRERRTYTMGWVDSLARRIITAANGGRDALVINKTDALLLLGALKTYRQAVTDRDNHDAFLITPNWTDANYQVTVEADANG